MESEAQRSPSQCSRALELFLYFFKIGFYTFGGGWSIVAQIQQEYVQKKGWITDEDLLAKTGGIVQGMSGSPILQDGKLVGAVTHVLLNDPTRGYGIFVENMLDAVS